MEGQITSKNQAIWVFSQQGKDFVELKEGPRPTVDQHQGAGGLPSGKVGGVAHGRSAHPVLQFLVLKCGYLLRTLTCSLQSNWSLQ
uniref:Uncharacterized protein n=1 Tax=Anguilla anguilla TaxID=7936 RepID=A0A0E9P7M2_ANGAN